MGYFSIQPQPYGMHDPMGMRYGLPPGLYDPRMQLSGGRHKKVRIVVLRTRNSPCFVGSMCWENKDAENGAVFKGSLELRPLRRCFVCVVSRRRWPGEVSFPSMFSIPGCR